MNWYYNSFSPVCWTALFLVYPFTQRIHHFHRAFLSCLYHFLSSPGDFLFFRLPTAASTSSLSMSSMCLCLLQGGISCNIVLSTGLVSLYSFAKYSFHLFLISVLLSSNFPFCLCPADWGKAIIVPIHKEKDNRDCNNYRGISLLTMPGKVYTSIL